MSRFLPFEDIEYKTRLSKAEVLQRLQESIEAQKSFGLFENNTIYSKPYIGVVSNNYFKIRRAITYRNSFLPEIKGNIIEDNAGTRIKVSMKLQSFVIAFMIVWFGGVFMACVGVAIAAFSGKSNLAFLIPFGMFLFGIALLYGGFKTESRRSINDLKELLQADIL